MRSGEDAPAPTQHACLILSLLDLIINGIASVFPAVNLVFFQSNPIQYLITLKTLEFIDDKCCFTFNEVSHFILFIPKTLFYLIHFQCKGLQVNNYNTFVEY